MADDSTARRLDATSAFSLIHARNVRRVQSLNTQSQ